MKAKIESTNTTVFLDAAKTIPARVWEGVSDAGVPFTAYIAEVQVRKNADNSEFERELSEHKMPTRETLFAIDARFVI